MLTVPEVARLTGKNPETIRRWIRSGRLHATKVGTQHVIEQAELDAVIGGVRAVGLSPGVPEDHRRFMDRVVQMLREDRDAS